MKTRKVKKSSLTPSQLVYRIIALGVTYLAISGLFQWFGVETHLMQIVVLEAIKWSLSAAYQIGLYMLLDVKSEKKVLKMVKLNKMTKKQKMEAFAKLLGYGADVAEKVGYEILKLWCIEEGYLKVKKRPKEAHFTKRSEVKKKVKK